MSYIINYALIPIQSLPSLQPQLHHPQAKLQWKRCADLLEEMSHVSQTVVMGEKVYVGGGITEEDQDRHHVYQYNPSWDEWSLLPPHPMIMFAMAQFRGHLITVGGEGAVGGVDITGKMYCFKEQSQKWEEFLKPMPTARGLLSVATTQSTIIASGGATGFRHGKSVPCATVEVYCSETSQWYTADPLPAPYYAMSSVTIADTCYLLGGWYANRKAATTVLYTPLTSLIQKATSPTRHSASHTSVWKTLPDSPLKASAAATLSGNLLAVGGHDNKVLASSAVNVFFPLTNSWVRIMTGDLPQPRKGCTAVQLSSNTMIVIGGKDNQYKLTKTVFIGTITV